MRGSASREAFAGVRNSSADEADQSDLSCCAYGRACRLFSDDDLAATLEAEQHLQPWLNNESVMVDRYDVRLLLHDAAQITKSVHRRSSPLQIGSSNDEAELEFERYRDLLPELRDPHTLPESEPSVPETGTLVLLQSCRRSGSLTHSVCVAQSEAQPDAAGYAAIPFVYDTPEAEEAQPVAPAPVPADAVPEVAFVPSFAVPLSVQDHLPKTERMHKVHCHCLHVLPWPYPLCYHDLTLSYLADHPADCKVCAASWRSDRVCAARQAGCKPQFQLS